jgi:acetoin utilization deacetylase AcuC-like enzyme
MVTPPLVVLSAVPPPSSPTSFRNAAEEEHHALLDHLDEFNHPRERRALILAALVQSDDAMEFWPDPDAAVGTDGTEDDNDDNDASLLQTVYAGVHSEGLLSFLETAWSQWRALGEAGRDPMGCLVRAAAPTIPSLVPAGAPLHRTTALPQRPSRHVLGQVGYYGTDQCTPIFAALRRELRSDARLVALLQEQLSPNDSSRTYYLLPHHPGHHAAPDCFGGYCYLNHVAALAHHLASSQQPGGGTVAILDVDYHCGNGTAAIFHDRADVLVISIHCDPDYDYPFHVGFAEDSTATTIHIPLPPGTGWATGYRAALLQAIDRVVAFSPTAAILISLGLDTYIDDPCAIRRAGFQLQGDDYVQMGRLLAEQLPPHLPTVVVQEGGYRMDAIGRAAADVVRTYARHRP